jgi:8-oxo-(d)GTP phosphatase
MAEPERRLLLLLRHAWSGERERWSGDDRERPLDAGGERQAAALPPLLVDAGFADAVLVSSPARRCLATLAPFAADIGAQVLSDDRLAEMLPTWAESADELVASWWAGRALAAIDVARSRAGARPVVVCSHGELLPAALAALAGREGFALPRGLDLAAKALPKGAGWIVESDTTGTTVRLLHAADTTLHPGG